MAGKHQGIKMTCILLTLTVTIQQIQVMLWSALKRKHLIWGRQSRRMTWKNSTEGMLWHQIINFGDSVFFSLIWVVYTSSCFKYLFSLQKRFIQLPWQQVEKHMTSNILSTGVKIMVYEKSDNCFNTTCQFLWYTRHSNCSELWGL